MPVPIYPMRQFLGSLLLLLAAKPGRPKVPGVPGHEHLNEPQLNRTEDCQKLLQYEPDWCMHGSGPYHQTFRYSNKSSIASNCYMCTCLSGNAEGIVNTLDYGPRDYPPLFLLRLQINALIEKHTL